MSDFPSEPFFIRNIYSGKVLDVANSGSEGSEIVLAYRKGSDHDGQLWTYGDGFFVNKHSGLVLEVPGYEGGGTITPGSVLRQSTKREKPDSLNQLWAYNYQLLCPYDPKVAITGEDADSEAGTRAVVDTVEHHDPKFQWMFDTV
ncbi:RICIN domain-containing protein [Streptomyces sp. NPDC056323]|uniref:RICIN domain-containing protein n=1 Tax=Streptomyces sp. NPDC056323 TaxID=3345784 RepID=UPI0035D82D3D